MKHKILDLDPSLRYFEKDFDLRMRNYRKTKKKLLASGQKLADFANGHLFFGFHRQEDGWIYREWAPGAERLFVTGDFCGWDRYAYPMERGENGVFTCFIPGRDTLQDGHRVMTVVQRQGRELERIPLYIHRVIQESDGSWNGVIYAPEEEFAWEDGNFKPQKDLFIYECHIGMAQEEGKVGSYREFTQNVLPRVKALGYNTLQIMAIMEHPYYASFGYQVTNFFAASSKFGRPEELKELINTAHKMGIAVLLDVVHSHACLNTREGINEFDGTSYQFFHEGSRGDHPAWNTKCFDYGKTEVLHFLLSNLKYWQEEYHFDGFRFDGVTSMLYRDHGLGTAFTSYDQYFSMNTDTEAVTYLQLANELVRQVNKHAITIAEDTSALPGLALPICWGGVGFDYRLAMGEPDMWIRLLKETPDEYWDLNNIYYELAVRRPGEPVIGYCESHDQALVGDKTIMFRLCDQEMYWGMGEQDQNMVVDRGMALHKMLRLITMSLGGEGYLTFMGNEFGHPEWIDFPREGNGWSYHYCRRQWSLADREDLKYKYLRAFDQAMVELAKEAKLFRNLDKQLYLHNNDKVVCYRKGKKIFVFNFHHSASYPGCRIPMDKAGAYKVSLSTDDYRFGGQGRIHHECYETKTDLNGNPYLELYIPARTAMVLDEK